MTNGILGAICRFLTVNGFSDTSLASIRQLSSDGELGVTASELNLSSVGTPTKILGAAATRDADEAIDVVDTAGTWGNGRDNGRNRKQSDEAARRKVDCLLLGTDWKTMKESAEVTGSHDLSEPTGKRARGGTAEKIDQANVNYQVGAKEKLSSKCVS